MCDGICHVSVLVPLVWVYTVVRGNVDVCDVHVFVLVEVQLDGVHLCEVAVYVVGRACL